MIEYKNRRYYNTSDFLTVADQTGDLFTYGVNMGGAIGDRVSWRSQLWFDDHHALEDYRSFDRYYAGLSVRLEFDLFAWTGWALTPFAYAYFVEYEDLAPPEREEGFDPIVREDLQWSAGAILDVPINEALGLNVQFQYTDNQSNLTRYTYENYQIITGPKLRF